MQDFEYAAPASIEEAITLLAEPGANARILAGGTDILVQLREGLRQTALVVDIKKIPELGAIAVAADGSLRLGAAVPCHRIWSDARLVAGYPAVTDSARIIGGWQIQGRASLGGNLCNSSPAADSIPALIVEKATCEIAGPRGRRQVPAVEFCTAPGKNVLERGEFVVALSFPPPEARAGSRYIRFIPRNEMDIAVAGSGVWLRLDAAGKTVEAARIALAAVAPTPVAATEAAEWLAGKPASEESWKKAGELARRVARPITDLRGPKEYRVHLVGVLVARALATAAERARGGDRDPMVPADGRPSGVR